VARRQQSFRDLAVAGRTRELVDRFAVPIETKPGEAVEDRLDRCLGRAFAVGVLDPQQHLAAASAGVKPVEKGCPCPANVKEARGRRSKARYDSLGHVG
jgi:hypothetical protein